MKIATLRFAWIVGLPLALGPGSLNALDDKAPIASLFSELSETMLAQLLKRQQPTSPFSIAMRYAVSREEFVPPPPEMERRLLALAGDGAKHYVLKADLDLPFGRGKLSADGKSLRYAGPTKRGTNTPVELYCVGGVHWWGGETLVVWWGPGDHGGGRSLLKFDGNRWLFDKDFGFHDVAPAPGSLNGRDGKKPITSLFMGLSEVMLSTMLKRSHPHSPYSIALAYDDSAEVFIGPPPEMEKRLLALTGEEGELYVRQADLDFGFLKRKRDDYGKAAKYYGLTRKGTDIRPNVYSVDAVQWWGGESVVVSWSVSSGVMSGGGGTSLLKYENDRWLFEKDLSLSDY